MQECKKKKKKKKKKKNTHTHTHTQLRNNNANNDIIMNDIMKIVQTLEDSGILLKHTSKTIENQKKEQKGAFLGMLLGNLGASLLKNMLADKCIVKTGYRNKQRQGLVRVGYGSKDF